MEDNKYDKLGKLVKPIIKLCFSCGNEFDDFHGTKKYCSKECRNRASYNRTKENKEPPKHIKICESCKTEFITGHSGKKYCSSKCLNKLSWERYRKKDRFCIVCDSKVEISAHNYCSDSCKAEAKKQRRLRDRDKKAVWIKQYRKDNKARLSEQKKEYYEANKDKIREYSKQYRKDNKEKGLFHNQKRRALKRGLSSQLTFTQWDAIKNAFSNCCAYCGQDKALEQEHFIALSKGGEHTYNNIIPACKSCNSSKGNKDFFQWYPKYKGYSKTRESTIMKHLMYSGGFQQLRMC